MIMVVVSDKDNDNESKNDKNYNTNIRNRGTILTITKIIIAKNMIRITTLRTKVQ